MCLNNYIIEYDEDKNHYLFYYKKIFIIRCVVCGERHLETRRLIKEEIPIFKLLALFNYTCCFKYNLMDMKLRNKKIYPIYNKNAHGVWLDTDKIRDRLFEEAPILETINKSKYVRLYGHIFFNNENIFDILNKI
jgi:hypothetical protein